MTNRFNEFIRSALVYGTMLAAVGVAQNEAERIYVGHILRREEATLGRDHASATAAMHLERTDGAVNSLLHYGIRKASREYRGE